MIGVILAAGDGKRLKKSSKEDCCKPLIKTNRKRLIEYALDNLVELGAVEAYVVVGKESGLIKNTLGNEYRGLKIRYVVQQEQNGLIDAFKQAVKVSGYNETVLLQLSDEIFTELKIEQIRNYIENGNYDFYCGITYEDDTEKIKNNFSVEIYDGGFIKECIEKPEKVINNIKGTGFCIFRGDALKILINKNSEEAELLYDLCDYINYLVAKKYKGLALHIAEKEFNINTFADLLEVQNFLEAE